MTIIRWGAKWRDRELTHLCFEDRLPKLFRTRAEARKWIEEKYGYIRTRPDLRTAPHWWKTPIAIKVRIEGAE